MKKGKNSIRSMGKTEIKCRKCGEFLYKTYLTGRLFCRTCWTYKTTYWNHKKLK